MVAGEPSSAATRPPFFRKRWWLGCLLGGLLIILAILAANLAVLHAGQGRIYFRAEEIPARDFAVILGTSPTLKNGAANPFFESRMDAAAELWQARKVRHFIVSGDNGRREYDEPTAMRQALVSRGIPEASVTLDYAGFRTLDTMARAHSVFGQSSITVITDDFHLSRSLFLARAHHLDAIGFGGVPVRWRWSMKTRTREIISRTAAWIDVHVLHTKPRVLGPPVVISLEEASKNPSEPPN